MICHPLSVRRVYAFQPGDHVVITNLIDQMGDVSFLGKRGVIIRRITEPIAGESSDDPSYLVAVHGLGRNTFWPEELVLAPTTTTKTTPPVRR